MAINKITPPTGGAPLTTADYNAQNQLLNSLINLSTNKQRFLTEWETTVKPDIAEGSIISHGGSLFLADSDTSIGTTTTPGDGEVWVRIAGDDTLTAEIIDDISGYSWNSVYNGYYDGSGNQILPVGMVKEGATYSGKKLINLSASSGISFYNDGKIGSRGVELIGTYTEDDLFNVLKYYVPVVGDVYTNIGGSISTSPDQIYTSISYMKRTSSSVISLVGFSVLYTSGPPDTAINFLTTQSSFGIDEGNSSSVIIFLGIG